MNLLNDLLKEYLSYMKLLNKAYATIERRKKILEHFFLFLAAKNKRDINSVLRKDITEYQKSLTDKRRTDGEKIDIDGRNRYISAVKMFFVYLKREGYIISDPAFDIELAKVPKRLPKDALPLRDIKKILKAPDINTLMGYRDRTMLEVFYSSGIRRSELRHLKIKDTDYIDGYLRVIGKGDKERVVPLGKTACSFVENYIKGIRPHLLEGRESEYLFFGRAGKVMSNHLLQAMLTRYVNQAKLDKHVTFHTFRRSCATGMIRNNANVMYVKALLGHDSMEAINQYIDLTIVDLKKTHKRCHPREKKVS